MQHQHILNALKKESIHLLQLLKTDTFDASEHINTCVQKRADLLEQLKNISSEDRLLLKKTSAKLLKEIDELGTQCINAVQAVSLELSQSQQQVTQGRQALQAYRPETENTSHFIEDDV